MTALLLAFGPLALYGLLLLVRVLARRGPDRRALNVELSALLALYFLATSALGVFWVANQELPPFDLHYSFGYATTLLVLAHLSFNLAAVVRHFARAKPRAQEARLRLPLALRALGGIALLGAAFFLGLRAGTTELRVGGDGAGESASAQAIVRYHAFSSHSRTGVLLRAPAVAWELPVARYSDRSGLVSTPLPKPDPARPVRGADAPMTLDDLSTLLWAGAGITDRRGGLDLRAAASSGALFPTELYVWVHDLTGLDPGTYAYQPEHHALARLPGHVPLAREPGAQATLIASSMFRRSGQKYRDRAYRYAAADAGHVLGNVIEAAGALGLGASVVARFDDGAVGRAVGADPREEGTMAMIALGPSVRPSVAPAPLLAPALPPEQELPLGATALAHWATALEPVATRDRPDQSQVLLPPRPPRTAAVLTTIAARRSARNFQTSPLTLEELSAVLGGAAHPPLLSRAIVTYLVIERVQGVEPAVYRHDAERNTLGLVRRGAWAEEAGRAALDQDVIANAPVSVILAFDRAVLAAEGPRAYRQAFLEAGIVGARLYLAAQAHGLGGCSVGAFYDQEAAALLGVKLDEEWPAHFFGLGRPE